jgi:hypothetical protein
MKTKVETSSNDPRRELAAQQEQLINALLGLTPAPPEVNAQQVAACGLSLKHKRARTLSKFENPLDTTCSIKPEMEKYFKENPGVHCDGPKADFKQYQRFVKQTFYRRLGKWLVNALSSNHRR